jgi:excisionase family DNA binding protein
MPESKDVLNVEETAILLGVSPWTVRELARQGRLPGRKVGKEWRFSRPALMVWLDGMPLDNAPPPPGPDPESTTSQW